TGSAQTTTSSKGPSQDASKLGAGGTSEATKGEPEADIGGVAKGVGGAAAAPAAGSASQLAIFAMFLNFLKSTMATMAAVAMNLMSALAMAALTAVNALVGAALSLGTAIASAVGGAISATAGAATSLGAAAVAFVSLVAGTVHTFQEGDATAQRDALLPDCRPATEAIVHEIDNNAQSEADAADMEEIAEEIYSILSGM